MVPLIILLAALVIGFGFAGCAAYYTGTTGTTVFPYLGTGESGVIRGGFGATGQGLLDDYGGGG